MDGAALLPDGSGRRDRRIEAQPRQEGAYAEGQGQAKVGGIRRQEDHELRAEGPDQPQRGQERRQQVRSMGTPHSRS